MKVAILTDFNYLPSQYGLVPAVLNQMRTLRKFGVQPDLLVMEGFKNHPDAAKVPSDIKVVNATPFMHLFDYQLGTPEQEYPVGPIGEPPTEGQPAKTNFKKQVQLATEMYESVLPAYNVVLTHDVMYQTWKLCFNQAVRNVAEKHPNIRWCHWCHSAPQPRPDDPQYPHSLRFTPMPNSTWVSMNDALAQKLAEQYNVPRKRVAVVYHQIDLQEGLNLHPLSAEMIDKHNLLEPEILMVCPTRLDHWRGKRLDKIAIFAAQLGKLTTAKLVFLNSWSAGDEAKSSIQQIKDIAINAGMDVGDLVFSSEMGKQYLSGVPHQVVMDLLGISNVFMLASEAETFSLITAEAAIKKNLLILNDDLAMMHELYGDTAMYVPFGSDWGGRRTTRDYQPNEQAFMLDRAKEVLAELRSNKALRSQRVALQHFTDKWVWENQLKPLLIEG